MYESFNAHPFDDAVYAQNALRFYYLTVLPFVSLPARNHYALIILSGYFITIVFSMLHIVK